MNGACASAKKRAISARIARFLMRQIINAVPRNAPCRVKIAMAIGTAASESPPAKRYSAVITSGCRPHAIAAAYSASENGSNASMVKFIRSMPKNRAK